MPLSYRSADEGEPSFTAAPSLMVRATKPVPVARPVVGYALRLRGIHVQSQMGVSDAERAKPQELVVAVDLELGGGLYPPTDELDRATDYAEIVRAADEGARERPYRLLETFALHLAQRLVTRWPNAEGVRVSVTKAHVPVSPLTDEATVEVTLGRALI
jgi:7,8-dihydroneopterin aldolase/epimerase/oxygenase